MTLSGPKTINRDLGQRPLHRVRVFVDFWNFTLGMRDVEAAFRTDWSRLGPVLTKATAELAGESQPYLSQGLDFYGSCDPVSRPVRRLHRWATAGVARLPGAQNRTRRRHRNSNGTNPLVSGGVTVPRLAA